MSQVIDRLGQNGLQLEKMSGRLFQVFIFFVSKMHLNSSWFVPPGRIWLVSFSRCPRSQNLRDTAFLTSSVHKPLYFDSLLWTRTTRVLHTYIYVTRNTHAYIHTRWKKEKLRQKSSQFNWTPSCLQRDYYETCESGSLFSFSINVKL